MSRSEARAACVGNFPKANKRSQKVVARGIHSGVIGPIISPVESYLSVSGQPSSTAGRSMQSSWCLSSQDGTGTNPPRR